MTHTIGEAIEGRLHEMRIQQKELAAVIDVPVSTLNSWLRLGRDIPAQYILKIAHVLRCTPTYLLSGGEDDRETPTKSDAIEDLIRATVAEVLRQQEAQKRRGDTESQARVAAHIERQREQLEQIRAEQAAEHGDPIRATPTPMRLTGTSRQRTSPPASSRTSSSTKATKPARRSSQLARSSKHQAFFSEARIRRASGLRTFQGIFLTAA